MKRLIESVTAIDVAIDVAGPGARAFAFLLDFGIRSVLLVASYVVGALIYHRAWSLRPPIEPTGAWLAVVLPPLAIFFFYHYVLEIALRGRTPGMRMAGVRLLAHDGTAPGVAGLLIRNIFRLIDSLPAVYGVGLLTTLLTREQVRIGDWAGGTWLAYERDALAPPETDTARAAAWSAARERARRLAQGRTADASDAGRVVEDYRRLAHDLAQSRRLEPDGPTRTYLEAVYAETHATLHRPAVHPGYALQRLFRDQIPQAVRELRPYILWVTLLFALSVFAGAWMVQSFPPLIRLFAAPEMIASVERGELWTQGLLNIVPSSVLSVQILTNNVVVSLFAYCAGFLFGLGTFYIVGLNGLTLGAVFAFTAQHGLDGELFGFIVGHGCVEISVMCLSGAAGAAVGEALIRPSTPRRSDALRIAARRSGELLAACAVLLLGAAIIEGYVSPDPLFPLWSRVVIGLGYWIFMVGLLTGAFFKRGASAAASHTRQRSPAPNSLHALQ